MRLVALVGKAAGLLPAHLLFAAAATATEEVSIGVLGASSDAPY